MLKVNAKNLGTIAILCLQGQLVNGETATLCDAVRDLSQVNAVILDLAGVNKVDAGGLGVMLELREQTAAKGIRFELMNLTRWVSKVLAISRLDSVFKINSAVEFFPTVSRSGRTPTGPLRSCA